MFGTEIGRPDASGPEKANGRQSWGGWSLLGVLVLYGGALWVATDLAPGRAVEELAVADVTDPLQHLWTLRWYRSSLMEGRSPLVSAGLQYPAGSPLGLYSPLLLQGALYVVCSMGTANDALLYNIVLLLQFLFTGISTYFLAQWLFRDRVSSAMAGLLAMLSGPMTFAARTGGTELLSLGGWPLFLLGWMRFVDRPSKGRLAVANLLFLLMAAGSAYYAVMSVIPATLYVLVSAMRGGRRGAIAWIKKDARWLVGFGVIAVLTLPLVLPAQLWAAAQGYPMGRSRAHFEQFHAEVAGYAIPPHGHRLASSLPTSWQRPEVQGAVPVYLGMVTLAMLGYGALGRVRFRGSGYLWLSLGVLVLLSMGAYAKVGSWKVPLPALWLYEHVPAFGSLRVPGRFGYLGAICASVLAGGAMATLRGRIRRKWLRLAVAPIAMVLAIADLSPSPFLTQPIPTMPTVYQSLREKDPEATFCEVHPTGNGFDYLRYESTLAYWQAKHGGRTSAGNPGVENRVFSALASSNSPFHYSRLADPGYLSAGGPEGFDLVRDADFEEYAWLYLMAMNYDYLIVHNWTWDGSPPPSPLLRIQDRLAGAMVAEDAKAGVVVFDRRKLERPSHPVALCRSGWRERLNRFGKTSAIAEREAEILVYNPTPEQPIRLELSASSYVDPRVVRLREGDRELARWEFRPESESIVRSPPFLLGAGLHSIVLSSESESQPLKPEYAPVARDVRPFSLWVSSLRVEGGPDRVAGEVEGVERLR